MLLPCVTMSIINGDDAFLSHNKSRVVCAAFTFSCYCLNHFVVSATSVRHSARVTAVYLSHPPQLFKRFTPIIQAVRPNFSGVCSHPPSGSGFCAASLPSCLLYIFIVGQAADCYQHYKFIPFYHENIPLLFI